MKYLIGLVAMLLPVFPGAQQLPVKALGIGDIVPDVKIHNIVNYKNTTASLSEFNSGLLILDFWATWCSSCLSNFHKMDDIEKDFGGSFQVLAVTSESKEKITNFLASKAGQQYHITSVTDDTALTILFPHRLIPHMVWIKDGRVIAITSADEVTSDNIRLQLSQQNAPLMVKKDISTERPLFLSSGYPEKNELLHYSIFSKGAYPGLGSGTVFRTQDSIIRGRAFTNEVLINMYEAAMRALFEAKHDIYSRKRLILNVKDTSEVFLTMGAYGIYSTANQYNFDLLVPLALADSLYPVMLHDLNLYSDFTGSIEKREQWCLVLKLNGTVDKIKTRGGKSQNTLFYKTPACLTNYPLRFLLNELNALDSIPLPVIDETGYAGKVDIELSGSTGLASLRSELRSYGLDLVKEKRLINMFILTDKK